MKLGSIKTETRACSVPLTTNDASPPLKKGFKKTIGGVNYICSFNPGTYVLFDGTPTRPCPTSPVVDCTK